MRVCVLASGSKGNAIYIEHRGRAIVVDQGLSMAELKRRMLLRDIDISTVCGILVSHEHRDHIAGVGVTARSLGIPVYATAGSFERMTSIFNGGEERIVIESGTPFSTDGFDIHPYSISHDAADPVQYVIAAGRKRLAVATDVGFISTLVTERLRDADLIILESNYDLDMLKKGSYPWQLKQRIMGKQGHLSNRNAAELIFNLTRNGRPKIILAHLSEENNHPDLAEQTVRELFERFDRAMNHLVVASQHEPTPVIEL